MITLSATMLLGESVAGRPVLLDYLECAVVNESGERSGDELLTFVGDGLEGTP